MTVTVTVPSTPPVELGTVTHPMTHPQKISIKGVQRDELP